MTVLTVKGFGDGCDIGRGRREFYIDKGIQKHKDAQSRESTRK